MTKSRGVRPPRKPWTNDQIAVLRARYPNERTEDLVEALGHSVPTIYGKAAKLGLKKSEEFKLSLESGRLRAGSHPNSVKTRFKPGHQTWNAGRKIVSHPNTVATQFKPGHLSGRAAEVVKPIGTERISKDGYRERKINNDLPFYKRWRMVHLLVWEAVNGPIPKGYALTFIDGNRQNCNLKNLKLIERRELMARNTIHNLPQPVVEVIQLRAAVVRKINRLERKLEDEQRNHN